MKCLIISDIHGSSYYLKKVLDLVDVNSLDQIIILGDILYHGPRNDLPKGYAPKEVVEILNGLKDKIIAVRGNCDAEVDQMVLDFPLEENSFLMDEVRMFLTHGHHINPDNPTPLPSRTIVLYGHTHIHNIEMVDGVVYINPGSISLAKGDMINSFALYENGDITIYDLDYKEIMKF